MLLNKLHELQRMQLVYETVYMCNSLIIIVQFLCNYFVTTIVMSCQWYFSSNFQNLTHDIMGIFL